MNNKSRHVNNVSHSKTFEGQQNNNPTPFKLT